MDLKNAVIVPKEIQLIVILRKDVSAHFMISFLHCVTDVGHLEIFNFTLCESKSDFGGGLERVIGGSCC
jgi:hypothetical protein